MVLFLFMQPLFAQSVTSSEILKRTINQKTFKEATLGILVKNLTTDEIIIDHQSDKKLAPASVLKIHSAVTAIQTFGLNHRFKTSLFISGHVSNGILYGDIVIKGFGDPTLGGDMDNAVDLQTLEADIKAALVTLKATCIFGSLVIDASYFPLPGVPSGYLQEDIANYYGAGVYGINVQDNAYEIEFNRLANGTVRISKFDSLAIDEITHDVRAKGSFDLAYAYFHPDHNKIHVVGSIPAGKGKFTIKGALKNPPQYLGNKIQRSLISDNYEFQTNPRVQWLPYVLNDEVLFRKEYQSPTLREILIPVLHKSNNVYAQGLYRQVMKSKSDEVSAQHFVDGSGLSSTNRVSAKYLMQNLDWIADEENSSELIDLFPENGKSGTVRSVLRNKPGRLRIKSGSIGGVRAYAGFHKTSSNEVIGFVLMANQLTGSGSQSRAAWETLLGWIAEL